MEEYRKAEVQMSDEIMRVMTSCFGDPMWVLKFFFKERLDIDNCYVCLGGGKVVSVLHALKFNVKIGRETLHGIYIYGACTLREYRNFGYMTNLINFVHKHYAESGYECSFLVPENNSLINFYKKLGYRNFFKIKRVTFSKDELIKFCKIENGLREEFPRFSLTPSEMENLRFEVYENQSTVIYSEKDIEFAGKLYELFSSGDIVSTSQGYAICGFVSSEELKIRDFTSKPSGENELLRKIYSRFPSVKKYTIETSVSNSFFKDFGAVYDYGMIYPFSELTAGLIESQSFLSGNDKAPYLGISLE